MSQPRLLGNGKLTVSARLSTVYGAAAMTALGVLLAFFAPKGWDMLVSIHDNVQQLKLARAVDDERHGALKERVDKIEDRLTSLEQTRVR
jgi:hypothetical protein